MIHFVKPQEDKMVYSCGEDGEKSDVQKNTERNPLLHKKKKADQEYRRLMDDDDVNIMVMKIKR